ncbi:MAG: LOW QUALITY PROTEIN: WD40-repeat-containing domain protein [Benniella sp.]|nr:MAG: LOW QUALITY PROTEIN: WD40-repeat-containing domain protein [Benniella sp.]
MIAKQLRKAEFTEPQIREMKHYRRFIVICDGYDESQQTHNLYKSNRLNEAGEWNAQMVISCRTEYVGAEYKDRFQPGDRNRRSDSTLFQEAVITPFSWDQVQEYIQQYVNLHQPLWQVSDYKRALDLIPSLKELVRNPFLMTLSLEVLPRMVDPGPDLSEARVTRVGLYDHFVEQWLERGKKRLGEKDMSPQARAAFESLNDEGFTRNGIEYLKKLAISIYREQAGLPIVEYSRFVDEGSWKDVFFGRDDKQLLREACPLKRNGNQHRFIHRSILEYGLARAGKSELLLGRRGSASSVLSFELEGPSGEQATTFEQEPDLSSPLVWRSFVNDHSLLQFLEERVQQEPAFKVQLLTYIEHSKKDKKWRKAAANAITILVRSGEQFIGADLRGVRIPGADLGYGVFDSAQLQNADLRKVNLRGVWLRQTDLSGAQMTGVQFGELPYLSEDNSVRSCAYSPDGKSFAVGFYNGNISVYSTSNWERSRKLSGHGEPVRRIMYSPRGDQLASASQDRTVRLWDANTGLQIHVLKDHTLYVHGVAYSPKGDLIASGSDDKSVRIWDVVTGDCRRVFSGHTRGVLSVAYSPNGNQVASSSADFTVRLWNLETGLCSRILSSHSDKVWEVAFSPSGDQLASVSADQTVQLYDAETGERIHVLRGHSSTVYSVFYSPKGDYVASGSLDGTVRLWDPETGANRQTLTGHNDVVTVVTYSPKGDQVASGSFDKTLRLWDVSADSFRCASHGHSAGVVTIKCSPRGDRIASGSMDRTIRLWDAETGTCRRTFIGHTDTVFSVAYSPQGDLIASGGADRSVRVWRVESGDCLHILTGHTHWVNCVTLSPEGDMVASAIWLWDVQDGGFLRTLGGHTEGVMSVTFSSNGAQIATGSKDKTVCQKVLRGHNNWIRDVVYSPQGEQLASASVDKTVRIWDVQTGECRLTLTVTYSANGKMLASGGWDKTMRLWDISTGECQAVNPIRCIAWSNTSDTSYLITGGGDGSWQVMEEEDQCRVQLRWGASNGASIQGALLNKQLLKQRGATGEPENLFREAGKRIITMKASEGTLVGSPLVIKPCQQEQPEQSEESISPRDV